MTFLDKLQPILPTTASTLNLFGKDCQKTSSSVLTVALRIFSVLSIPLTLITDIFLLPFRGYYYFTKQKNFTIKSTSKNPPEAAPSPRSLAPIAAPQTTAPWHKRLSETASQLRSFLPNLSQVGDKTAEGLRTAALDPEDQELLKNLKICLPVLHKTIVFTMEDLSSLEKVEENKLKTIALIVSYAFASIGDLSFAVVRLLRYVLTMKDTELATPASFSVPTAVSDVWRACKQWLSWS